MITDSKLHALVSAAEAQVGQDNEPSGARRSERPILPPSLSEPIIKYLLAPYENGYWELRAKWNPASPFVRYLLEVSGIEEMLDKENGNLLANALARKISDEAREQLVTIANRLSTINKIFRYVIRTRDGAQATKLTEKDAWIAKIDIADFCSRFSSAVDIFVDRLYFDKFMTVMAVDRPFQTQSGIISTLEAPKQRSAVVLIAMDCEEVAAFRDFYTELGVVYEASIRRVFAPDEALLKPYFGLVSSVLNHLIQDVQISVLFKQALEYYEEQDYQHCISSLGLIAEDYLQRIYTTLLRESAPGGMTLGQTVERLHRRIDDLSPVPKPGLKELDPIYERIKALAPEPEVKQMQAILRDLLTVIKDDRAFHGRRIDEIVRPALRRSIFPQPISDNLNELLKWRNAASHNSRIPLGAHEADRTLFCLVCLISWWGRVIADLNWTKSSKEIIDELLQRAK